VLGQLSNDGLIVEHLIDIYYDGATDCEKNWAPRGGGEHLELVYSYDPFTLLEMPDPLRFGGCLVRKTVPPIVATRWRGGAFDRYTGIVHEVVRHENHNVYFHRFIEESDGCIVKASRPFTFDHHGIEYAAGIHWTSMRVVVTYSFEDKEARFIVFSRDEFGRLFP
jgi:hypothetical protein